MKAVAYRRSAGLVFEEVPRPDIGDQEVLVRVVNTGFCGSDHSIVESGLAPDGYILGHEASGVIEALSRDVQGLKLGSRVMIRPTFCGKCRNCEGGRPYLCTNNRRGIGVGDLPGAFAEYVKCLPQMIIPIPDGVDSQSAALAEAFASALHGIHRSGVRGGNVLIIGGGTIGLCTVQLCKVMGFSKIALSEPIEHKRLLGQTFGADFTIDPRSADLSKAAREWTGGVGFDLVLECSAVPQNVQASLDALATGGTICLVSTYFKPITIERPLDLYFKEVHIRVSANNTHEENVQCLQWLQQKKLDARALITDRTPLEGLPTVYRERIHTGKAVKVMVQIGDEFEDTAPACQPAPRRS